MATHPQWTHAFLQLGIKVQQRHSCQSVRKDLGEPFLGCSAARKIHFFGLVILGDMSMAGDVELFDGWTQQNHLESQKKFTKKQNKTKQQTHATLPACLQL